MKLNTLQFGKAMGAALFVLLLSVAGMKNALAQTQVATLQHGDSIADVFYGQNALVSAYNAATSGDVITLSSGTFNKCEIGKSITIRGAGCIYDTLTNILPTIIPDEFNLTRSNIHFEGILFTGNVKSYVAWSPPFNDNNNVTFVKCNINKIGSNGVGNKMNWQFVNCIINRFEPGSICSFHGMSIINSVIEFVNYDHSDIYNPTTISNSVVLFDNGQAIKNIEAYNSIIAIVSDHTISNCTFFNCIGIETGEALLFEGQTAQNVMEVDSYDDVFETFAGTVFYDNLFQLKAEVAASFLGNDGTEVGIYGGMMPYNPRPTYMIIKRCNVAPRSTVDGKLSVDIEILTDGE